MSLSGLVFIAALLSSLTVSSQHGFNEVNRERYEEGKLQYQVIERKASLPKYGQCWKDAITTIQQGCKELTDVVQSHLALAYLNCFLEVQEREVYNCNLGDSIAHCTKAMSDVDRGSFTTFFTYTHNICYFLESQIWHQETDKTINRLASKSEEVASQLEESSELQGEMIKQQNKTLKNQENILKTAENLSDIISSSKENIHEMFSEFKRTTSEQRLLINDVFDRVARLQTMVLGEFSGFYSIIYYTLSILVSYLLTSTHRTSGARFWLFGVMTLGIIAERTWFSLRGSSFAGTLLSAAADADNEENMYYMQWMLRKGCGLVALVILAVSAYRYKDINYINNQLLQDINNKINALSQKPPALTADTSGTVQSYSMPLTAPADSTGYESDSAVSDCSFVTNSSMTSLSDHTFLPALTNHEESESSSICTDKSSLVTELEDLREATPFKEMSNRISTWAKTGYYKHSTPIKDLDSDSSIAASVKKRRSKSGSPAPASAKQQTRYNLRVRGQRSSLKNPLVDLETPGSFSRVVKQLERIAVHNSMLASNYTIKRKSNISDVSYDGGE